MQQQDNNAGLRATLGEFFEKEITEVPEENKKRKITYQEDEEQEHEMKKKSKDKKKSRKKNFDRRDAVNEADIEKIQQKIESMRQNGEIDPELIRIFEEEYHNDPHMSL